MLKSRQTRKDLNIDDVPEESIKKEKTAPKDDDKMDDMWSVAQKNKRKQSKSST